MFLNRTLIPYFMEFLNLKQLVQVSSLKKEYFFYTKIFSLFSICKQRMIIGYWNWGMACASLYGHKDLVYFFISKGANNWDCGMAYAAEGCHKDLVNFFIRKGADNWNWGMDYATEGGHKELVEFFREKLN